MFLISITTLKLTAKQILIKCHLNLVHFRIISILIYWKIYHRKDKKQLTSTKWKINPCNGCPNVFTSLPYFKRYLMNINHCKYLSLFPYKFCEYVGCNESRIVHHLSKNETCSYLYEENYADTRLLPDTISSCNINYDN